MKYQLVLQLPGSSLEDYDEMIELEEIIIAGLDDLGTVDGHDSGQGEMNIFVHTNNPRLAFKKIMSLPKFSNIPNIKAAYRDFTKEDYIIIHPPDLKVFDIA